MAKEAKKSSEDKNKPAAKTETIETTAKPAEETAKEAVTAI